MVDNPTGSTSASAVTNGDQATQAVSKTRRVMGVATSVLGGILQGIGVSDGGITHALTGTPNQPRGYEASNTSGSNHQSVRNIVGGQLKIPEPYEIEEAIRDMENDPKMPEDNDIGTAINRVHEEVIQGFTAVKDVVQQNFTMVERKLNEHATAINTISSDQRRLKRNFEDLEARFGRIERGGGGLQSSKKGFEFGGAAASGLQHHVAAGGGGGVLDTITTFG